jgi:hypothetical protein
MMRVAAASRGVTAAPMPTGYGLALLADIPDRQRRDGGPELVIRGEHPVVAMPVLPRWRPGTSMKILVRAATALWRSARKQRNRFGTEITHCRTGTGGMTWSTRCAAVAGRPTRSRTASCRGVANAALLRDRPGRRIGRIPGRKRPERGATGRFRLAAPRAEGQQHRLARSRRGPEAGHSAWKACPSSQSPTPNPRTRPA